MQPMYIDEPENYIQEFARNYAYQTNISYIPGFLLKNQTTLKSGAYLNGKLAKRFDSGQEKIRPVIFSHGLTADFNLYSCLLREYASQGYLVIAMNH